MGILYVVATPIGNLEDVTLRAVRVLKEVSVVFCEDARYTKRLLDHFEIKTPTMTLYEHSGVSTFEKVNELLQQGKDVAYVTDAGTPGISDPGGKLVQYLVERDNGVAIIPVPGPSALTASLSVAGINLERFVFMGFPPAKNKRNKYFGEVVAYEYPVVFYESTYRLIKSLEQLSEHNNELYIIVCGELTKKFEKVYRGTILKVIADLKHSDTRGEYVIIVYKTKVSSSDFEIYEEE